MSVQPLRLQVVITAGPDDPAKAVFALDLAMASAVSGVQTAVFLTLDATEWACETPTHDTSQVVTMLGQLTNLGVPIACCSACAVHRCGEPIAAAATQACSIPFAGHTRDGVTIEGLTTLVERIASGIPTVTF